MHEPPVRLCCYTRHWGVVCPDGTFMCDLCFNKVSFEDSHTDDEGNRWDICKPCGRINHD